MGHSPLPTLRARDANRISVSTGLRRGQDAITADRRFRRYAAGRQPGSVEDSGDRPAVFRAFATQVAPGLSLYQLLAYNLLIAGGGLTLRVLTSMLGSTKRS